MKQGTCLELQLRPGLWSDPREWFSELRDYLLRTLVRIPCEFRLSSPLRGCATLTLAPGWSRTRGYLQDAVLGDPLAPPPPLLVHPHLNIMPQEQRVTILARQDELRELKEAAVDSLRWLEITGHLDDGLGRYRILVPFFQLPGGRCLAFLRVRKSGQQRELARCADSYVWLPSTASIFGYKGMLVPEVVRSRGRGVEHTYFSRRASVEVDFETPKAGSLQVNRGTFTLSADGEACLRHLRDKVRGVVGQFAEDNSDSPYGTITRAVGVRGKPLREPFWLASSDASCQATAPWMNIAFPAITTSPWVSHKRVPTHVRWRGQDVSVLPWLQAADIRRGSPDIWVGWIDSTVPPSRIVEYAPWFVSDLGLAPLWASAPTETSCARHPLQMKAVFPPPWLTLCGAFFENYNVPGSRVTVLNKNHRAVEASSIGAWDRVAAKLRQSADPLDLKDEILSDPCLTAAWLLLVIASPLNSQPTYIWRGLVERDPSFLWAVWHLLFGPGQSVGNATPICFWTELPGDSQKFLEVLTPQDRRRYGYQESAEIREHLPDPGPEWRLEICVEDAEPDKRPTRSGSKGRGGSPKKS